jgi:hypothetical protein
MHACVPMCIDCCDHGARLQGGKEGDHRQLRDLRDRLDMHKREAAMMATSIEILEKRIDKKVCEALCVCWNVCAHAVVSACPGAC